MSNNGLENYYVIRGQKKLRFGYTTGSCAAAACRGAVEMLLGEKEVKEVKLMTPKGISLLLALEETKREEKWVSCGVRKDGGEMCIRDRVYIVCFREKQSFSV